MIALCTGVAISAIILSGIALAMACIVWAKMVGLEKSTHQVQFVPLETPEGAPIQGEELDKQMMNAFAEDNFEKEYT